MIRRSVCMLLMLALVSACTGQIAPLTDSTAIVVAMPPEHLRAMRNIESAV